MTDTYPRRERGDSPQGTVPFFRPRRWLLGAAKLAIVAVVLWFIRGRIVEWWGDLEGHKFHFDIGWLAAAGGFYLLGSLCCGLFWHRTLRALGQDVGLPTALRAFFIGHLGKYVPGKAMVVVLRASLIRGPGVEASLAVVSVFIETLTMMSVGALLAATIVVVWFPEQPLWLAASLAMMAVAGLPTLPPVFRRVVRWVTLGRLKPETLQKLDRLGYGTMLLGWALNVLGWTLLGLSYWAALRALGAASGSPWASLHLYVASVALATVAGFLSFVPSGAVVREAVLTELMAPQIGGTMAGTTALTAAVLLRLAWLAAELLASAVLWWGPRGARRGTRGKG
jgi:glycosyltransferase 2 family protein